MRPKFPFWPKHFRLLRASVWLQGILPVVVVGGPLQALVAPCSNALSPVLRLPPASVEPCAADAAQNVPSVGHWPAPPFFGSY